MDRHTTSRFGRLMGNNMGAFHVMVEGALKDWHGTYDVLLPDTKEYLFEAKRSETFGPFCRRIREFPRGEELCVKCDLQAAEEAERYSQPIIYPCHAGLQDIAVPIIVNGELVATIFCGQARLKSADWDAESLEEAQSLERELGLPSGELAELREEVPQVPYEQLEEVARRIFTMASFVSQMLETNLQRQEVNDRLWRIQGEQALRRKRSQQIEQAVAELFTLSKTWEELWQGLEQVLQKVTYILGASHAVFLLHEVSEDDIETTTVQLTANMPASFNKGQTYKKHDDLFHDWADVEDVYRSRFNDSIPDTLCWDLKGARPTTAASLHTTVSVRVRLTDRIKGLIVLFLEEETAAKLDLEEERANLNLIASRVARAYHNTGVYLAQVIEEGQRREWLRRVSHQIIAPLGGLVGHAGSLLEQFERWQQRSPKQFLGWSEEDLARWGNALDSILWTADWAARLTRNLAWMAEPKKDRKKLTEVDLETIHNVPDFLIECARFVQGIARERRVRMVHVDKDSVANLSGRLRIYPDYFRQALLNLLDNAVKYADPGTTVTVDGRATNGHCRIRIINYGINLHKRDCERIFDYEFRTSEARRRYPTGTGIGLSIAREIVELHGGTLTAEPSRRTSEGWKTTFTISLPLAKGKPS